MPVSSASVGPSKVAVGSKDTDRGEAAPPLVATAVWLTRAPVPS